MDDRLASLLAHGCLQSQSSANLCSARIADRYRTVVAAKAGVGRESRRPRGVSCQGRQAGERNTRAKCHQQDAMPYTCYIAPGATTIRYLFPQLTFCLSMVGSGGSQHIITEHGRSIFSNAKGGRGFSPSENRPTLISMCFNRRSLSSDIIIYDHLLAGNAAFAGTYIEQDQG